MLSRLESSRTHRHFNRRPQFCIRLKKAKDGGLGWISFYLSLTVCVWQCSVIFYRLVIVSVDDEWFWTCFLAEYRSVNIWSLGNFKWQLMRVKACYLLQVLDVLSILRHEFFYNIFVVYSYHICSWLCLGLTVWDFKQVSTSFS